MWIILEGIDRSGKSTVAEYYEKNGYLVFHMEAPNKKYSTPGYTGPSYLDDCVEKYMELDGKDVVFDRSVYGELIWPEVYGRAKQLDSEDFEVLKEIETSNNTQYIYMYDQDVKAHWKRCFDNKEPLNKQQFDIASFLYKKVLVEENKFDSFQLPDWEEKIKGLSKEEPVINFSKDDKEDIVIEMEDEIEEESPHQKKLREANAINKVLSMRVIKYKGDIYDSIEKKIKNYLQNELSNIFSDNKVNSLSDEDIFIFKKYVERLKAKMETK